MARGTTPREIAEGIGADLARAGVAAVVAGSIVELSRPIESDATLSILTAKSPEALDVLRNSAAHVLTTAVRCVRPDAGIGFGPAIDTGFYYDFDVLEPFTPEELEKIEAEMRAVAGRTETADLDEAPDAID